MVSPLIPVFFICDPSGEEVVNVEGGEEPDARIAAGAGGPKNVVGGPAALVVVQARRVPPQQPGARFIEELGRGAKRFQIEELRFDEVVEALNVGLVVFLSRGNEPVGGSEGVLHDVAEPAVLGP